MVFIQAELSSYDAICEYGAGNMAAIPLLPDNKIDMKMAEQRCKDMALMVQGVMGEDEILHHSYKHRDHS